MPSSGWKTFWRNRVNLKRALTATGGGAAQCAVTAQSCAVGIGHSHLMAFVYAQQGRIEQEQPLKTHLHWILLQDDEFNPNLVTKGGRTALNPALQKRLDAELASLPQAPPFLYASISGNEYLYVGHTEHPRPFDFCLPERPELQVRSGVEIIPPSLMRKTLERSMENALAIMGALREATDLPIVFIQSPPPVFSNDHIREHPGPFKEAIDENGVTPPGLRMKLWLLQSSIYRQRCEELGCRFMEVPGEVIDGSGFLREPGSWPDSVHANPWYGEIVLQKIESEFQQSREVEVVR